MDLYKLLGRGGRQRVPAIGQHELSVPAVPIAAGLYNHGV